MDLGECNVAELPKMVVTPPGPKAKELKSQENDVYAPIQMAVYPDLSTTQKGVLWLM